jgi:hypothetical protein
MYWLAVEFYYRPSVGSSICINVDFTTVILLQLTLNFTRPSVGSSSSINVLDLMYKVGSTEGPPANFSAGVTLGALQERVPSATLGVLRQARLLPL